MLYGINSNSMPVPDSIPISDAMKEPISDAMKEYLADQNLRISMSCPVCTELLTESFQVDCKDPEGDCLPQGHNFHLKCARDYFGEINEKYELKTAKKCMFRCNKKVTKLKRNPLMSELAQLLSKKQQIPVPPVVSDVAKAAEAASAAAAEPPSLRSKVLGHVLGPRGEVLGDESQGWQSSRFDCSRSLYVAFGAESLVQQITIYACKDLTVQLRVTVGILRGEEFLTLIHPLNLDQLTIKQLAPIKEKKMSVVSVSFAPLDLEETRRLFGFLCSQLVEFPERYRGLVNKLIDRGQWTEDDFR